MTATHKGEYPFIIFMIPFIAGIACGLNVFPSGSATWLYITLGLFTVVFISLNILYKRLSIYKMRWLGGAIMHLILLVGGWLCVVNYNELNSSNHFSKIRGHMLLMTINNEPKTSNGITRFTANVEQVVTGFGEGHSKTATGSLLVSVKDSSAQKLAYGDQVWIWHDYNPVPPPANPAEFNYKQYLANQNIHFETVLTPDKDFGKLEFFVFRHDNGNPLIAYALRTRQHLVDELRKNIYSPEALAVASTLILGYKADLNNDILQAYSKTGTIHVLSVSGAHVAILYILLELIFGFLSRYRYGRLVKTVLIVLIIWYYAMLSGFSPAVCRAAFMISMVIAGKAWNRAISTLNILAVSAFFLLLYDPLFIADVGFQLSYLSVAGLIIFQPIVYKWFKFKNKWADKLWALCSVSIAAQVITFPLSAFYFHQFPVYFLVSNLFIIIPSAIIMYAGIAYFLLGWIPAIGKLLGFILEKTILTMDGGLAFVEHIPFASINKIWLTTFEYLLLYAIIIAAFYYIRNRRSWLLRLGLFSTLAFAGSISIKRWKHSQTNEIVFLALKRHTGIIFRSGNNAAILTDLKDTDKTYHYSVQPYLDSCQVSTTYRCHPDSDIRKNFILKKDNAITFDHKTMLIYNSSLQNINPSARAIFDYLITDTTAQLTTIKKNFEYNLLIIHDSHADTTISQLQMRSKAMHENFVFWGGNKSIKLKSN